MNIKALLVLYEENPSVTDEFPSKGPAMQLASPCHDVMSCRLVTPYSDRSGSTLILEMAWWLTAPSHYLKQCWLIISKFHWHLSDGIPQEKPQPSITKISLKVTHLKFNSNLPRGQWVKTLLQSVYIYICKSVAWIILWLMSQLMWF